MPGIKPHLKSDEAIDHLRCANLQIIQARSGYRASIDPVLLCSFARLPRGTQIADLGTGNGIIPLILASRDETLEIVGVERQPSMADRAGRSVGLNNLQDQIQIIKGDVRDLPAEMKARSFDVVTMNPPYRIPTAGRLASNIERAAARHEISGNYRDFLQASNRLLDRGGSLFLIFLAERLAELLGGMSRLNLEPKRLRLVHSRQGQAAKLVLVEGRKEARPGMQVEPPLFIYTGEGRDYTDEVLEMYGETRDARRGTPTGKS